jgi:hypothetical protein
MDVIEHEIVVLAVEVVQPAGDDLGETWITQGTVATRGDASVVLSRCSTSFSENRPWWQRLVFCHTAANRRGESQGGGGIVTLCPYARPLFPSTLAMQH